MHAASVTTMVDMCNLYMTIGKITKYKLYNTLVTVQAAIIQG